MKLSARKCQKCGNPDIAKGGGCISFRYQDPAAQLEWKRGYFHLGCFKKALASQQFHRPIKALDTQRVVCDSGASSTPRRHE